MTPLSEYPYTSLITTRWADNDIYGHVNNVEYYAFFDTIINKYLIAECGLDIHRGAAIGLCAESHCTFKAPLEYPHDVHAGLRVGKLGNSSVRYEIGLYAASDLERPVAEGWFVHVFVDRDERRSTPLPDAMRAGLERIVRS